MSDTSCLFQRLDTATLSWTYTMCSLGDSLRRLLGLWPQPNYFWAYAFFCGQIWLDFFFGLTLSLAAKFRLLLHWAYAFFCCQFLYFFMFMAIIYFSISIFNFWTYIFLNARYLDLDFDLFISVDFQYKSYQTENI